MNSPKINPFFILVIGVITVSASAILVKLCTSDSGVIAFYRLFFSVIIMLPIFLMKNIKELKGITKRDWIFSIISGVCLAFHFILWFESLNYTSVASSTVLVTLQPLFAFLGTFFFFKESFSLKAILCGICAVVGSVIISWGDFTVSGMALFGDLLAFLACILVTAYLLFGQNVRQRLSLMTYTFIVYAISSIVLIIYVLFAGESLLPTKQTDWIYFILLAILPTLLGHSLFNWVVKWLSTSIISMAILFEPIGASILAYFILQEKILWTQIMGGAVIIISISLFIIDEKKSKAKALDKHALHAQ
ncbi:DMT family transporter [Heyndrickxia oleronia]|uniref:EamA family transporter n=1 Tax=Heyndrickxia oleronia TaxID=38875 RepID=A0A8E2LBY8_9BACI|nr:DMT family transporter [Heyndrickxia oleronia]MEC1376724.1 DMT family transporter [Heyndrickxia oleronia]OOP64650.1 EamA family transporter [Heyndrickxia oleronia]QQZ06271.1 EamA family transporter [Heyndrickxia oleronia]